jgi:hypothetical protein
MPEKEHGLEKKDKGGVGQRDCRHFLRSQFVTSNRHAPQASPAALASLISVIRGERVMLDTDLAALYCVETRALNQAVRRNADLFPEDFMFRLTRQEYDALRARVGMSSQTVMTSRRPLQANPLAFTEQGIAMLSSVLKSPIARQVNIAIMRTFVQLRRLMDSNRELARQIEAMEKKYDEQFAVVFDAIKQLIAEDAVRKAQPKRPIGFRP